MLQSIILGVIIGIVAGVALTQQHVRGDVIQNIGLGFTCIVVLVFVFSSFTHGPFDGFMSIVEIVGGFWLTSALIKKQELNLQ